MRFYMGVRTVLWALRHPLFALHQAIYHQPYSNRCWRRPNPA
ncbi:MAG: hypothetical protein ABR961_03230 [Thermoanaerobaculaceae bacterium]|jgi:hypothetical protein